MRIITVYVAVLLSANVMIARTLVTELPDLDGDGDAERIYVTEFPEHPEPFTMERHLKIYPGADTIEFEQYLIEFYHIESDFVETVQVFTVKELTPEVAVIYLVYRGKMGSSAGWGDNAMMLVPREGKLEPIWSAEIANWSGSHGGYHLDVRYDDLDEDGMPEIVTEGTGTLDTGTGEDGKKIFEDYNVEKKVYKYDDAGERYLLVEQGGE